MNEYGFMKQIIIMQSNQFDEHKFIENIFVIYLELNGKRNDGLFCDIYSKNDDANIHKNKSYDYVLNKRKLKRMQEILDCSED